MKRYFPILFILAFFPCCKKAGKANQIPPLTYTGKDFLAFKTNGNAYTINCHQSNNFSALGCGGVEGVNYIKYNPIFYINSNDSNYQLTIQFKFTNTTGIYNIISTDTLSQYPYVLGAFYTDKMKGQKYQTDINHAGTVSVLFYDGNIISGIFSFDAVDSNTVVHITDGEFDIGPQ